MLTRETYWKLDNDDIQYEDLDLLKQIVRQRLIDEIAERAKFIAQEENWHDLIRFTLKAEEVMNRFSAEFDRKAARHIFSFEIPYAMYPVQISGMSYTRSR